MFGRGDDGDDLKAKFSALMGAALDAALYSLLSDDDDGGPEATTHKPGDSPEPLPKAEGRTAKIPLLEGKIISREAHLKRLTPGTDLYFCYQALILSPEPQALETVRLKMEEIAERSFTRRQAGRCLTKLSSAGLAIRSDTKNITVKSGTKQTKQYSYCASDGTVEIT